jgi:hypothetical protein
MDGASDRGIRSMYPVMCEHRDVLAMSQIYVTTSRYAYTQVTVTTVPRSVTEDIQC